jgi:hypothetical protein
LSLLLVAASASGQSIATLISSGSPPPDGNGTINGFGFPVLNDQGEVALVLGMIGTQNPSQDASGIYLVDVDGASKLVRTGETVPNGNGFFRYFSYDFNYLERIAINDSGAVAFSANLDDTVGTFTDNSGIFTVSAAGDVTEHVRISDPAPDGNGFFGPPDGDPIARGLSDAGIDNQNQTTFQAFLNNTTGGPNFEDDTNGIFRSNGTTTTRLLRGAQPEPFGTGTVDRVSPLFSSTLVGQSSMVGEIYWDFEPTVPTLAPPPEDLERLYVANQTALDEILRSGVPAPDGHGKVCCVQRATRLSDSGSVLFEALAYDTGDSSEGFRRLYLTDGVTLQEIARLGQLGLEETELFRLDTFIGLDINAHDEVVFSVILHRNAVPPDNRTTAIYRWKNGVLSVAAHQDDPAPDGNGTFGDVAKPVFLNDNGQIVFEARIEDSKPIPLIGFDQGIFVIDSTDTISEVARTGKPLAGSTVVLAQYLGSFLGLPADPLFDNDPYGLGGVNAINNSGQVPFTAQLGDGSQAGLFLYGASEVFSGGFEGGDFAGWDGVSP